MLEQPDGTTASRLFWPATGQKMCDFWQASCSSAGVATLG